MEEKYFIEMCGLTETLAQIKKTFTGEEYNLQKLWTKYRALQRPGVNEGEKLDMLVRAAAELTTQEAPQWEMIAARLLMFKFTHILEGNLHRLSVHSFYEKLVYLTGEGLYGSYILENYTKEEIDSFASYIKDTRND